MKKIAHIFLGIVVVLGIGLVLIERPWMFSEQASTPASRDMTPPSVSSGGLQHAPCLSEGEDISYEFGIRDNLTTTTLKLTIFDKEDHQIKDSFVLVDIDSSRVAEIQECGVYFIRTLRADYRTMDFKIGFDKALWAHDYSGREKKILTLAARPDDSPPVLYYPSDFRIDPSERYLVLEKSFLGKDDYALVVKDLGTLRDVFVLKLADLLAQNPGIQSGSFDLGTWTEDGKYLWGSLYDGPFETAWYRIEAGTWKVEVFPPPPDIKSGVERAWNFRGWIAYADITSFTGDANITKQIEEEAVNQGKQKHLWLYNFFTKQKTLIASTDPSWRFDINLTETALTYHLPGQATSTYVISR